MNGWTSVKDKDNYPGFGQVCDVKASDIVSEFEDVAVAYITAGYGRLMWHTEDEQDYAPTVTHWKPHTKQETN